MSQTPEVVTIRWYHNPVYQLYRSFPELLIWNLRYHIDPSPNVSPCMTDPCEFVPKIMGRLLIHTKLEVTLTEPCILSDGSYILRLPPKIIVSDPDLVVNISIHNSFQLISSIWHKKRKISPITTCDRRYFSVPMPFWKFYAHVHILSAYQTYDANSFLNLLTFQRLHQFDLFGRQLKFLGPLI